MRKIEKKMNEAIRSRQNWTSGNTCVFSEDGVANVYLHGNLIARVGDSFMDILDGGWQTVTTKSRLNALINEFCNPFTCGVFQRDFQWYVVDDNVEIPFGGGYRFT